MKFMMRAWSSDSDYSANIDNVWVDVTPDLAKLILSRRKLFLKAKEADDSLWEMYFGNSHARYFSYDAVPEQFRKELDDEPIETEWEPKDDGERTECDQMVIDGQGVSWTCIPKHQEIYITSEPIPYEKIEACL